LYVASRQDSERLIHRQLVAGRQHDGGSVHGETREELRYAAAEMCTGVGFGREEVGNEDVKADIGHVRSET